jgi:hypothetical protein
MQQHTIKGGIGLIKGVFRENKYRFSEREVQLEHNRATFVTPDFSHTGRLIFSEEYFDFEKYRKIIFACSIQYKAILKSCHSSDENSSQHPLGESLRSCRSSLLLRKSLLRPLRIELLIKDIIHTLLFHNCIGPLPVIRSSGLHSRQETRGTDAVFG